MPTNIIIMSFLVFLCVIIILHEEHKATITSMENCEKYAKELVKKIDLEIKLKKIIIASKQNKENYFVTLEKIEKELFKQ